VQGAGLSGAGWDTTGSRTLKRFDVYKRALMLTAATVALLSGPAFGQTDITTKTTKPLTASADGPITLAATGSIIIPSSSSATAAAAAITLDDTATPANNVFTSALGSQITFNGTPFAEAFQGNPNVTGEIISGGTVTMTGSGTDKNAIVFGDPTLLTSGTFTGTADTINNTATTANPNALTALALLSGATVAVQGDGSSDLEVISGNTVTGDLLIAGSMTDEATSLTSATTTSPIAAVNLAGTLNGRFYIETGGSISATGAGAEGVIDLGQINGSITNFGVIETIGMSTTLTAKQEQEEQQGQSIGTKTTGNPEAGSALIIGNNVTGGIYNGGPGNGDTTTVRATISASGNVPAVVITPDYGANTAATTIAPLTIGGYTDPLGIFGNVSFLNRGIITATPENYDSSSIGVAISGVSTVTQATLTNGLVNAGTIGSAAVTDAHATTASSQVTALSIGDFVTIGTNTGTQAGYGPGYAIVNSNESQSGSINATVGGVGPGIATAIQIGSTTSATDTSVPSLFNSGSITAAATSTDPTITGLQAYAIEDFSGTLVNIVNSGTISAVTTALNNFSNVSRAISVQDAASGVTITNTGTIAGDILLGQHADTITLAGASPQQESSIFGNIFFGGNVDGGNTADTLTVGTDSVVSGSILEQIGGSINASVASAGVLDVQNNGTTVNNQALPAGTAPNFLVSQLTVNAGGTLDVTLTQAFNQESNGTITPIVQGTAANGYSGAISLNASSILNLNFGSFVSPNNLPAGQTSGTSRFVVFDAPSGQLQIAEPQAVINSITNSIPFLFSGSGSYVCGYNVAGFAGATACTGADEAPEGTSRSDLVLDLTPKTANDIGLTGYAAKMFPLANQALANDPVLGAAVINAGAGNLQLTTGEGQKIYQGIYSAFAPDVTGADRAVAISITDQATGPVGARQRALRMYAGLDGDATLWGQEFGQRLNTGNSANTTGYANSGFGFALGADSGDPHDGRYGAAFTFYSGTTSEKAPRTSKTLSDWVMLTGYSDWRGHGIFFDSQLSAGYGQITGKRSIVIGNAVADCNGGVTCTATGKRPAALLAGGVTTGTIYHSGGTVFIPQISLDGMTMREDGYTESTPNLVTQSTSGFDLHVKPFYASSVRAFAGADLRQDLKFGDYFVQPEARAGFRYDLLGGAEKLKAEFACSAVATGSCGDTAFTISGPDPAKGNIVVGGGIAVTTGAWSLGLSYDYLRGVGGVKSTDQTATFTLIGRI
jgi:hypothetical protein